LHPDTLGNLRVIQDKNGALAPHSSYLQPIVFRGVVIMRQLIFPAQKIPLIERTGLRRTRRERFLLHTNADIDGDVIRQIVAAARHTHRLAVRRQVYEVAMSRDGFASTEAYGIILVRTDIMIIVGAGYAEIADP